jgi:peptidoglycan/LPS O-acetylase OafA/YrhL
MTIADALQPSSTRVRWSWGFAVIGLAVAILTVLLVSVGIGLLKPLYWPGIVYSLGGILGAAVYGSKYTNTLYAIGVVLAVACVLVVAYGVENQMTLVTIGGIFGVLAGAVVVFVDNQRIE